MAVTKQLDTRRPHPVQLLGLDYVLWHEDSTGQWRMFDDRWGRARLGLALVHTRGAVGWSKQPTGPSHVVPRRCPHRSAPLSEGRIIDGQLNCSFHGWKFEGSGACTSIPQVRGGGAARSWVLRGVRPAAVA